MTKLLKTDDVIIHTCDGDDLSDEEALIAFSLSKEDSNPAPQFFFVKRASTFYYEGSE